MKTFYFTKYENRKPYRYVPHSELRAYLFQFLAILTVFFGVAYLWWRWTSSLNPDALWFAIPLVSAETLSFVGTLLVIMNYWNNRDPKITPPVRYLSEIEELRGRPDRPVKLDLYIATYNEDVEMVRYSIRDAKKITYPFDDVEIKIFVLDDGRRDGRDPEKQNMKQVAEEEGVGYFSRESNEGYKAGNLKNALDHTTADIFVILDADSRPYPSLLVNTTGYFRNKKLAWVQTPQWFYDLTEAEKLSDWFDWKLNIKNKYLKKVNHFLFGKIEINEDIFGNDSQVFFDVILRRRNLYNAAFCCGASSIHRREAVMNLAVKDFATLVKKQVGKKIKEPFLTEDEYKEYVKDSMQNYNLTPFKYHASEDIYTSIMLHADKVNKWESLQHPNVECKMLSTLDLDSVVKQRTRYASGSLDIALKENPLFLSGLTIAQRLQYFTTVWSYFAPVWIIVFLLSPVIFYFTLTPPIKAFNFDFFKYFLTFQTLNTLTFAVGCWGIKTSRGDQYYISSFWFVTRSIISVLKGEKVKFNVTPKTRQFSANFQHTLPHLIIIGLTFLGITYNLFLLGIEHHPSVSSFVANSFWAMLNVYSLSVVIRAGNYIPVDERVKPAPETN